MATQSRNRLPSGKSSSAEGNNMGLADTIAVRNVEGFNACIAMYQDVLGKSTKEVVLQQSKLLAVELMHQTPPWENGTDGTSLAGRKVGMEAVRRDLIKIVTPSKMLFRDEFKNKSLEKIVRRKDYNKLNAALEHIPKLKKWRAVPFNENLHRTVKYSYSKFGNVNLKKQVTMDNREWNKYLSKVQDRVGMVKAGWGLAAEALGAKVPKWVSRHFGYCNGRFINWDIDPEKPQITMENETPVRLVSKYNFAYYKRQREMQEDIAYKLKWIEKHNRRAG